MKGKATKLKEKLGRGRLEKRARAVEQNSEMAIEVKLGKGMNLRAVLLRSCVSEIRMF